MPLRTEISHVHIVDDDDSVRKGLSRLMRSAGIESDAYGNPESFFAEVCNEDHACILMDITMPRMSGLELMQKLNERDVKLPVIVITGFAEVPLAVEAMKSGAVTFLEKPFQDQDLWQNIQQALEDMYGPRGGRGRADRADDDDSHRHLAAAPVHHHRDRAEPRPAYDRGPGCVRPRLARWHGRHPRRDWGREIHLDQPGPALL